MFVFFKILNYETTRRDSRGSGGRDSRGSGGLNSPNGTPHNKFEEYKSISISGDIYNSFLENTLNKYSSGKVRYSGKYYNIPSGVFSDTSNWSNGNFFYNTGENRTYGLESTGTAGRSIFWKTTK